MPGKRVRTSILMAWGGHGRGYSGWGIIINDFQRATDAFLGASNLEEGADGMDGVALFTDHFSDIIRVESDLIGGRAFPGMGGDLHFVRVIDQALNDVFDKVLHGGKAPWVPGKVGEEPFRGLRIRRPGWCGVRGG